MTQTQTFSLMCQLLEGLNGMDITKDVTDTRYTAKGSECVVEYNGSFYTVKVEALWPNGKKDSEVKA